MANLQELKINNIPYLDIIYPVGCIFQTIESSFNPNNTFGGTWTRIKGKFLIGVDEDDTNYNYGQMTGGEKVHTLTINEMPSHSHTFTKNIIDGSAMDGSVNRFVLCIGGGSDLAEYNMINSQGGAKPQQSSTLLFSIYLEKRGITHGKTK